MASKNPQTVAQKWSTNLAGSTTSIQAGVQAVTVAPGVTAAANVATWLAKIQQSQAKWVRNVSAVTLGEWQQAMITKGIPRISTGATAAEPKMAAFFTQFLPYLDAGKSQIASMPKTSLAQSIAKAAAQITYNSQFTYQR